MTESSVVLLKGSLKFAQGIEAKFSAQRRLLFFSFLSFFLIFFFFFFFVPQLDKGHGIRDLWRLRTGRGKGTKELPLDRGDRSGSKADGIL